MVVVVRLHEVSIAKGLRHTQDIAVEEPTVMAVGQKEAVEGGHTAGEGLRLMGWEHIEDIGRLLAVEGTLDEDGNLRPMGVV